MLDNFKKQGSILADYLASINRKISHGQSLEAAARMNGHKSWNHAVGAAKSLEKPTREERVSDSVPCTLLTPAVSASVWSDDRVFEARFDAVAWFAQADDKAIFDLYKCDWSNDYLADDVLEHFRDALEDVTDLFDYLDTRNRSHSGDAIGFECAVTSVDALVWLKIHRPQLFIRILLDMDGKDQRCGTDERSGEEQAFLDGLERDLLGDDFASRVEQARAADTQETLVALARQASRMTVLEVCMPDVFGQTDVPEEIPEWSWIQQHGSFFHRGNNKEPGVWEFMVHIHHAWQEGKRVPGVPARLQPFFDEAQRIGAPWVMFHQG